MEIIQSRQNSLVKACVKLAENRRERLKQGLTLLDGTHLITAAMDAGLPLERIVVAQSALLKPEVAQVLERYHGSHSVVEDGIFNEITELESASGVLAIWRIPASRSAVTKGFVLALDGVQDPGNVGSIMRTAAAAGVNQVWLGLGCADAWSPKVLRAGMGAHFLLPLIERVSLPEVLLSFGGKRVATALDGSVDLYTTDLRGDVVLTLGSEGQGVSPEVLAASDIRVRIPMLRALESLNVGAAAAVCLYERVRQQQLP
jgi:TrmH family RNA methyltransferase